MAKSTTEAGPEFKAKNSKGQSYKTIPKGGDSDGGGDEENAKVSKRSTKGMRPGTGRGAGKNEEPKPYTKKNSAGQSHKLIAPKDNASDSGRAIDAWVSGKTNTYK